MMAVERGGSGCTASYAMLPICFACKAHVDAFKSTVLWTWQESVALPRRGCAGGTTTTSSGLPAAPRQYIDNEWIMT